MWTQRTIAVRSRRRDGRASALAAAMTVVVAMAACGDSTTIAPFIPAGHAPPVISHVEASSVTVSDASILWLTDRPTTGLLEYGTTTSYGDSAGAETAPDTIHETALTGLAPATTYHYRVTARDTTGASASAEGVFTTQPEPEPEPEPQVDDQPPAIAQVSVTTTTTAATVSWTTDEPTTGFVEHGGTASYGDSSSVEASATTTHEATLTGLVAGTTYHFRIAASDTAGNVTVSPDATFVTEPEPQPSSGDGVWIGRSEIATLPMSGAAWDNLLAEANGSCGLVDLANQEQSNNVCIMAKALVFARTGDVRYRTDVLAAVTQISVVPLYLGRALALGRELAAYVIAADLIELKSVDPVLDGIFRAALRTLLTTFTSGGPSSLVDCHEHRPNNWGTHCGAARAAVAAYLGDTAELERVAQVFKGWLGERSSYAGFTYGDLSWQCDTSRPVGINPVGCTRDGNPLDGVLPDDQRRAGTYIWPAPQEHYVWEALQGALAQAVILDRAGYPVWDWGDRALLRAVTWLYDVNGFPAEGDDEWQPHVINHFYGTSFPARSGAHAGKNVGWTDWTHP